MSVAFDKVIAGLKDARAYLNGTRDGLSRMKSRCPSLTWPPFGPHAGADDRALYG